MFNPICTIFAPALGVAMSPPTAWTMKLRISVRTNHLAMTAALSPPTLPSGCQYNTMRAKVMYAKALIQRGASRNKSSHEVA
jgi:hypothetical protein